MMVLAAHARRFSVSTEAKERRTSQRVHLLVLYSCSRYLVYVCLFSPCVSSFPSSEVTFSALSLSISWNGHVPTRPLRRRLVCERKGICPARRQGAFCHSTSCVISIVLLHASSFVIYFTCVTTCEPPTMHTDPEYQCVV